MFNGEQRGLATDERRMSLAPIFIALLNTYAGLSTAVAGFVLNSTAMVVVGMLLVGSGAVLIRWPPSTRRRRVSNASHRIHRGSR
jgi:NAD(P) transhydrogenase beta subunit